MRRALLALALPAVLMGQAPTAPAKPAVDIGKLLMEAARMKMDAKTTLTTGAFWISPAVMEAILQSFSASNSGDKAQVDEIMKAIRNYQVFMVQREYLDGLGEQKTVSAEELRSSSWLENDQGQRVAAVDSLPPAAREFIGNFKRGMESRSKGQHFELLIFPQQDAKGNSLERAVKPGRIKLTLGKVQTLEPLELTWHYPFDALSAPKECPKCHEVLSASWTFCAYCGTAAAPR